MLSRHSLSGEYPPRLTHAALVHLAGNAGLETLLHDLAGLPLMTIFFDSENQAVSAFDLRRPTYCISASTATAPACPRMNA